MPLTNHHQRTEYHYYLPYSGVAQGEVMKLQKEASKKNYPGPIDQFRYMKIQVETIDLSTRLWGINTEFVGFIPQSLVLKSIV